MGVVIQEMAPVTSAGVLFTLDPVTSDPGVMVINANYGLGESVVSGCSEPDLVKVKRTWENKLSLLSEEIGSKKTLIKMIGKAIPSLPLFKCGLTHFNWLT